MTVFRIDCGYRNYDWGKLGLTLAVAKFAASLNPNTKVDELKPYAELWMGTHPLVPSVVVDNGKLLREVIEADPSLVTEPVIKKFGVNVELPFLFKVLLINKALSIQAHPDKLLGKVLHANDPKNYPDDNHKPEMAIALIDFEGFCGFKPLDQLATTLKTIPEFREIIGDDIAEQFINGIDTTATEGLEADKNNRKLLQAVFGKLMHTDEATIQTQAKKLVNRAETNPDALNAIDSRLAELIVRLNKQFPEDVGLFCGCLMLNHCELKAGEAMFLKAKDPHAYILGDIIECMAALDNVVRAGFTPKFKDVDNLVDMLTYSYDPIEKQKMPTTPCDKASGQALKCVVFNPPIDEFAVLQTVLDKQGDKEHFDAFDGPSIIIATNGAGTLKADGQEYPFAQGYVYFIGPNTAYDLVASEAGFTTYRAYA